MSDASKEHVELNRVRPRFKVETHHNAEHLIEKIKNGLQKEDAPCFGRIMPGYATLYIPVNDQHYWSPQLSLSLEEIENGTILRGLYGPRPGVWTMFIFFYSLIGFAALVVIIIGLSYLTLDRSAAILWLVPVLLLAFLSLYLVAYFGKKMGHDQMVTLHRFVEKCTELKI